MKKSNSSRNPKNPASLLSDEYVPEIINRFLIASKVNIYRVKDLGLTSEPDDVIFKRATQLKLPIITLDIRFAGQIYRRQSYVNGLVLLRYKGKVTTSLLSSLKKFLGENELNKIKNCIVVIDEHKYRIARKNFKHFQMIKFLQKFAPTLT
ncbi:MAG: hypothetical protein UR98_C0038G0004 [Parcubacteria group bacterium GW2011_GWA1_36_12]|nr:MAG: hypothetical protein UR98_C0038G0004 [Parcubacteria group bacterium GW2011_GWA1_36_12]